MATRIRIRCINKTDRYSPYDRISHVGGGTGDHRWRQTQEQTIREIENGEYEYYVEVDGETADVIVATKDDRKYIKTKPDGEQPNNLLSLPECPKN
ncbi:DUF3892 domain-containing protein [Methyloligella sp. GL2]|nr:DUF3892 domain-containing protein [Methyloligella sp. GL2]